jgi:hypothetical protein
MDRALTAAANQLPKGRPSSQRLRPSEALRALNRERIGLVSELRCECGQPTCRDTLPLVAEAYRGIADLYIVMPAHFSGGVVLRAADRFFVVELGGRTLPWSQGGL